MCCALCGKTREVSYKCSQRFCPLCAWKIAERRRMLISEMTSGAYDVKHVVLTQRNFYDDLHGEIRKCRKNLFKLRRKKIMQKVTGGCASLEITNEEKGWHIHWHLLVQAKFVNAQELAVSWGKLVGQDYAIVKIKNVEGLTYVQEVCKYVAKGSDIAGWSPKQILDFCLALRGTRSFTCFGQFTKLAKMCRQKIDEEKIPPEPCNCGCDEVFSARSEFEARQIYRSRWEKAARV